MAAKITNLNVPVIGDTASVHFHLQDRAGSINVILKAETAVTEEEVRELAKAALNEALAAL
ncbi:MULTISPECIES: hypothetical protein [unclassified Sulfitobacter]|jgi:hypothetical protein|uniref:hypothetical protein n=1 Tax=unclassified Sulfitobacter TaxID=196795 RepID=UPI0007C3FBAE|nr:MULTISPECIES: hypothetical protein [unclassified Sulfitobacter]KZX95490.1 hypothetical protein A3722_17960 [Sulfitobacter sp. HI0027]KZX98173.1 hypothetical protein A3720_16500 [Sulfitobacter sp. HI0021]KZZ03114.1 hypothetical protein A3747_13090 [Sulfitobacter sp. HI0076]